MRNALPVLTVIISFSVLSCSSILPEGFSFPKFSFPKFGLPGKEKPIEKTAYELFKEKEEYPAFYETFKEEELLALGNSSNTSLIVDISDQRAQLLVNGVVAMDFPCCTGRAGKVTPAGTFGIMEKIKDKKSNIYGSVYNGSSKVYGGDQRKYKGPRTRFVGTSLPYWMRLTGDGIGLHYSKSVKRSPASGGCIRMPMSEIQTVYSKVKRGTKVTVQQ